MKQIFQNEWIQISFTSGSRHGILYGLPKIHKTNLPVGPILSALVTGSYNMSKHFIPVPRKFTISQAPFIFDWNSSC